MTQPGTLTCAGGRGQISLLWHRCRLESSMISTGLPLDCAKILYKKIKGSMADWMFCQSQWGNYFEVYPTENVLLGSLYLRKATSALPLVRHLPWPTSCVCVCVVTSTIISGHKALKSTPLTYSTDILHKNHTSIYSCSFDKRAKFL